MRLPNRVRRGCRTECDSGSPLFAGISDFTRGPAHERAILEEKYLRSVEQRRAPIPSEGTEQSGVATAHQFLGSVRQLFEASSAFVRSARVQRGGKRGQWRSYSYSSAVASRIRRAGSRIRRAALAISSGAPRASAAQARASAAQPPLPVPRRCREAAHFSPGSSALCSRSRSSCPFT